MRGLLGHQAVDFLGAAMAKAVAHAVMVVAARAGWPKSAKDGGLLVLYWMGRVITQAAEMF